MLLDSGMKFKTCFFVIIQIQFLAQWPALAGGAVGGKEIKLKSCFPGANSILVVLKICLAGSVDRNTVKQCV